MRKDGYTYLRIGDKVQEIKIQTLEKSIVSTAGGYVVLINFFIIPCKHCKKMLEYFEEHLWQDSGKKGLHLVCVGRGHTREEIAAFREKGNYNLVFAADEDRSIYSCFAEKKVPRNYLFDKDGTLVYQTRGFDRDKMNTLRSVLGELVL